MKDKELWQIKLSDWKPKKKFSLTEKELEDIVDCIDGCIGEDGFSHSSEDRARLTKLANKIDRYLEEQ